MYTVCTAFSSRIRWYVAERSPFVFSMASLGHIGSADAWKRCWNWSSSCSVAPRAFARDARAKKLFRNSSGPAELSSAYTGRTVSIAITAKTAGALENEGLSWLCRPARAQNNHLTSFSVARYCVGRCP